MSGQLPTACGDSFEIVYLLLNAFGILAGESFIFSILGFGPPYNTC